MQRTNMSKMLLRAAAAGVSAVLSAALVVGVGTAGSAQLAVEDPFCGWYDGGNDFDYDAGGCINGVPVTVGSGGTTTNDDSLSPPTGRYWR